MAKPHAGLRGNWGMFGRCGPYNIGGFNAYFAAASCPGILEGVNPRRTHALK